MCQSLTSSGRVSEAGSAEKEGPTPSEGLLGLWFFSFLQHVTPAPPWSIKGRAGHPAKVMDKLIERSTDTTEQHTSHTAKQRPSSWHPLRPFHQRLGIFPSLDRLYPLLRTFFGTDNTSSSRLGVGTFSLNQYKPCVL